MDLYISSDLHENSFDIHLDINQWEKIVASEIREQSANMTRPKKMGMEYLPSLLVSGNCTINGCFGKSNQIAHLD